MTPAAARGSGVVAAVGRRIDAPDADEKHFPPELEDSVAAKARAALAELRPAYLVASAACGADIIVLEIARDLKIPYAIVLPSEVDRFKAKSVVDRGTEWGPRFDAVWRGASETRIIEPRDLRGADPYSKVNEVVLALGTAMAKSPGAGRTALVLWDGKRKGERDYTADFRDLARAAGWTIREIHTFADADS